MYCKGKNQKNLIYFSCLFTFTEFVYINNVPGLESLGEDKILNNAPSLRPVTKLRSSSCNIGVLTLARANTQDG